MTIICAMALTLRFQPNQQFPNCCQCIFNVSQKGSSDVSHVLSPWWGLKKRNADHAWNPGNTYITCTRGPLLWYRGISSYPFVNMTRVLVLNTKSADWFKVKKKPQPGRKPQICFLLCRLPEIPGTTHSISPSSYVSVSTGWFEVALSSYSTQNKNCSCCHPGSSETGFQWLLR